MATSGPIFISYQRDDFGVANLVRQALRGEGFDIWWDENLQIGKKWEEEIDRALFAANAIIVLWSNKSVLSDWVCHEASIGKIHNNLVHARIDSTNISNIPEPFRVIQLADLSQWNGQENDPKFQEIVKSIRDTNKRHVKSYFKKRLIIWSVVAIILCLAVYLLVCISNKKPCPVPVQYIELRSGEFHSGTFDVSSWPEFGDAQLTLDGTRYPLANLRALCFPIENGQGFIEVETNDGKRTRYLATTDFLRGRKVPFKGGFAREEFPISKIKCLRWHCVRPATPTDK